MDILFVVRYNYNSPYDRFCMGNWFHIQMILCRKNRGFLLFPAYSSIPAGW